MTKRGATGSKAVGKEQQVRGPFTELSSLLDHRKMLALTVCKTRSRDVPVQFGTAQRRRLVVM